MYIKLVFPIPVNQFYYYSVPKEKEQDISIGKRVQVQFHHHLAIGYIIDILGEIKIANVEIKPIIAVVDESPVINQPLINLAYWMMDYYFVSLGEILKIMIPSALKMKPYNFPAIESGEKINQLTSSQKKIYNELIQLKLPDYALIHGVTGSGKTEIYLALMEDFIKKKSRFSILFLKLLSRLNSFQPSLDVLGKNALLLSIVI